MVGLAGPQRVVIWELADRRHQGVEDFVDKTLGVVVHLSIRAVLHGMRDEDASHFLEPESLSLMAGGLDEL